MDFLLSCIEAFALVAALSIDAFIACIAYGTNHIKIPFWSVIIINAVCSSVIGLSLLIGNILADYIPKSFTSYLCFIILFIIALTKFFDFVIKRWIEKQHCSTPSTEFRILNFRFYLQLITDPTQADVDSSLVLSIKEAFMLGISLSLDGLAVGLGAGMVATNYLQVVIFSFALGIAAVLSGCWLGNILVKKTELNLSWLSGVILMILAFSKIL